MIKDIYRFLSGKYQNVFLDYKVVPKPRYGHGQPIHELLDSIISLGRISYTSLIEDILNHKEDFWRLKEKMHERSIDFQWRNGFFPGLDTVMLHHMIGAYKPSKYLEVGSGHSTKIANQSILDHSLATELISIDPQPRAEIDQLASKVIRQPFENLDMSIIDSLGANDIFFIDNSHRILPNSDSMVFYLEALPRLKRGVIVHIHDIYLPYDYPQFMCDRFYSEQYGLAIALLSNPQKYQVLAPNYYISEDQQLSQLLSPLWNQESVADAERHGGSFWFKVAQ